MLQIRAALQSLGSLIGCSFQPDFRPLFDVTHAGWAHDVLAMHGMLQEHGVQQEQCGFALG